ncbi:MAG TPA: insulinase family protein, partial [Verrucomicrobiales bacterium]|nr:insulinase family protein [Verrucomicrobiales bacterium]
MKQFLLTTLCLAVVTADAADDIPDRPEKLKFPALKYEPPTGADYRVQLKNGPVAYLVPDRELPLVSISIRVRTGGYEV